MRIIPISVSIIIPTKNRQLSLFNLIQSIQIKSSLIKEVLVIDSSDNNINYRKILSLDSKINLYQLKNNSVNQSYSRNIGIKKAGGDILAFIDDDCIVSKGWLKEVIYYFKKFPHRILMGKNINGYPNNLIANVEDFRTKRFFNNKYKKNNLLHCKYLDTKNFIVGKELLIKNNLHFDKELFYAEDIDLSLRLQDLSIPILYCPKIIAYHYGITSFIDLMKKEIKQGRAKYLLVKKWHFLGKKTVKKDLSFIKDLLADSMIKKSSLFNKLLYIVIFIFCSVFFRIGWYIESKSKAISK